MAAARRHGVEELFTLSGGHVFPPVRRGGQGRPAAAPGRRPPRADGGVRGRGHGQAAAPARVGRAHRRARSDQRGQRHHHRPLQRLAGAGAGRPGPDRPLGRRQPPGARPPRHWWRPSPSTPAPSATSPPSPRRSTGRCAWLPSPTGAGVPRHRLGGAVLGQAVGPCPTRRRRPAEARPGRPGRGGPAAGRGRAAGAGPGVRRLGRPGRGRGPPLRRGPGPAGGRQRPGPRHPPPGGDGLLVTRARSLAFGAADLVLVAGAPLDFRLGYGSFGGGDGARAKVVHLVDARVQATTSGWPGARPATSAWSWTAIEAVAAEPGRRPDTGPWLARLRDRARAAAAARPGAARRRRRPDPPGPGLRGAAAAAGRRRGRDRRRRRLRVVRRTVRGAGPARQLARPRAVRLPRHRAGLRRRRPPGPPLGPGGAPAGRRRGRVLPDGRGHPGPPRPPGGAGLRQQRHLGPGEAPDADAVRLRRRRRPAAPVPLRRLVAEALGAAGELVATPAELGPALRRAFDAGVPYLVNVATDPEVAYPRSTSGL